jgi:hypothetical protein
VERDHTPAVLALRQHSRLEVDSDLVAAALLIEMSVRGPAWRHLEWLAARALTALGATGRVARMSVGPAQIQPCRLNLGATAENLAGLMNLQKAFHACESIMDATCSDLGLSKDRAKAWSSDDWRRVGKVYNGSLDYGDVLAATYATLHGRKNRRSDGR